MMLVLNLRNISASRKQLILSYGAGIQHSGSVAASLGIIMLEFFLKSLHFGYLLVTSKKLMTDSNQPCYHAL